MALATHDEPRYKCEICSKENTEKFFSNADAYDLHMYRKHYKAELAELREHVRVLEVMK